MWALTEDTLFLYAAPLFELYPSILYQNLSIPVNLSKAGSQSMKQIYISLLKFVWELSRLLGHGPLLPHKTDAVSYTHLDVYKRQVPNYL